MKYFRDNLLPCPFCGGQPEGALNQYTRVAWVECLVCKVSQRSHHGVGEAVKAWNTRTQDVQPSNTEPNETL